MKIWTVANQKGGVGKTTTTVTLGALLAQKGYRVMLVDTDPHASLSYYFGVDSEELSGSVYDVFTAGSNLSSDTVLDALCPTKLDSLFLLPATMALATLDRSMGTQSGMGLLLKKALHLVESEFDYVLIDCPPVLGVLMVNALAACEQILVPVQTEYLALKGLDRMMRTLEIMRGNQSGEYQFTIVPTMYDKRTKAALESYQRLKQTYGDKVWNGVIPVDTRFRDASQALTPPPVYCPKSRGVIAYERLLTSIEQ
ncbi:Sporulation initiation inhibitor protein Soj [Saliniradius amylolyticus]|uniref:Sporulation initiation inhibitor protein Soj n=1 Tax=Saliniradius amylolyticus TaxID=2183582 RepID=A0A2S2E0Y0_9ALTE|nr:ParA family protein [Saliniradius amylolyticus]AWL11298.1 Sporulation initiation inhibitor protein Soj [Saliniradius amylolyticus]